MKRALAASILLGFVLAAAGCRDGRTVAAWFGAADKAVPAAVTFDILCDASAGSSCNGTSLTQTLDATLGTAVARPGSTVRVWMQGSRIEATHVVGIAVSPTRRIRSRRARAEAEKRWIKQEASVLADAATATMRRRIRRSPIAESIGLIALAPLASHGNRYVVVITDALEVSEFGDFECARLPKPDRFARSLAEHRVLPPHTLTGARVTFCYVDLGPIDRGRCGASLARAAEVRALWRHALTAAGASAVEIRQGGVDEIDTNGTETTSND